MDMQSLSVGQPLVLSNLETTIKNWMNSKSKPFSAICGENVTRMEVIVTNVAIIAMFLFAALVNMIVTVLEGGTL